MEKRRDPLEGFDWVFKPEPVDPPPDMQDDDSFVRLFGSGPTMHDLEPITETEVVFAPEPTFLMRVFREHPRLRRATVRTSLVVGAIVAGVSTAFITHTPATSTEALPQQIHSPRPGPSSRHTNTSAPITSSTKKPSPRTPNTSPAMTPMAFSYSASASPSFIPRMPSPSPTISETVDATSRPPTNSATPTETPSETCAVTPSPSASTSETTSPTKPEAPSELPTDVESTFAQTEMPQASQSPSLGD